MKKFRALAAEVAEIRRALSSGRVSIQLAQTNVVQPGGASTFITEGPTNGSTQLKGDDFVILLNNPGGK